MASYQSVDDSLGALELASARYRVDDLTHVRQVLDWQTIADPEPRGTVAISAAQNAMYGDVNERELRQVTFELTDTTGNVRQQLAYYELARVYQGVSA